MSKPIETYRAVDRGEDLTPYQAVALLLDGALESISTAIIAKHHQRPAERGEAVSTTLTIISVLQGSLDHRLGGELAANLDALYDYMIRRLASVAVEQSAQSLEEVQAIILQLREGWAQIDPAQEPTRLK